MTDDPAREAFEKCVPFCGAGEPGPSEISDRDDAFDFFLAGWRAQEEYLHMCEHGKPLERL